MDLLTRADLKTLLEQRPGWHVSLLIPTQRGGSEADPIRFRKALVAATDKLIAASVRSSEAREFLAPAHALLEDSLFWRNQSDGLAVYLAPNFLRIYRLPLSLPEVVAVGDKFHIKPLLPLLAGDGRFFVLALSSNGVRLLQGTRQAVHALDLRGVPANLASALIRHDRDEPLTFHARPAGGIGSWGAIFSGQGVGIDDRKDDLLLYFRQVDRGLHELLREEKAPLVLAAVDYFHPLYRSVNTYPHLASEGILGNPDRLSDRELHDLAWPLVQPLFQHPQTRAVQQYHQLVGTGRTASRVEEVVPAAWRGEIETLFVASDKDVWGRLEAATAKVEAHTEAAPGDEDLGNVAAIAALRHGRNVFVVPPPEMPNGGPLAGIYCLPMDKHG